MSHEGALSAEVRRRLYYRLRLLRQVEERIVADYHHKEMRSPPHLYIGHEAVAVGVCTALRADDLVFPYYRSHGWYLAKGGELKALMAELFGRETGCSKGWGGSMHVIDLKAGVMGTSAIVGGTISHALGAALALRMQGKTSVVAVSFGDGATEEGVFHEALNFATLRRLPILFVCENNLYSTNTHIRDRQAQLDIYRRAEGYGLPGHLVDGNDVVAVYGEAAQAIARARSGGGPTLLECRTYRVLEHCGVNADDDLGYRTANEVAQWRARDPLTQARHLVAGNEAERIVEEIRVSVDEAFADARSSPFPASLVPEGARP
ncbi:MAG: thiamine pyrophosphate-dependent dehydrogenase E1 component subunit alpha [Candidatus Omnitrophica bacterium]|nr:thiamine pyrophosphate-dependent dehydrogenase E1 component subunit alpha [Candidatus Omnitrophota bacterium]